MALLTPGDGEGQVDVPTIVADDLVFNILNMIYYITGIIAVLAIVGAAFMYITSRGDLDKTVKARRVIIYSTGGLIVIFAAFMITEFVIRRLG